MLFLITNNAFLKAIYTFPMTFYYSILSLVWSYALPQSVLQTKRYLTAILCLHCCKLAVNFLFLTNFDCIYLEFCSDQTGKQCMHDFIFRMYCTTKLHRLKKTKMKATVIKHQSSVTMISALLQICGIPFKKPSKVKYIKL